MGKGETMVKATGETVSTWADASGIWHARVSFPDDGYGPGYLAANIARIRAKARRAVRREISARQGEQSFIVRIQVVSNDLDSMNVMHSITFAEVTK